MKNASQTRKTTKRIKPSKEVKHHKTLIENLPPNQQRHSKLPKNKVKDKRSNTGKKTEVDRNEDSSQDCFIINLDEEDLVEEEDLIKDDEIIEIEENNMFSTGQSEIRKSSLKMKKPRSTFKTCPLKIRVGTQFPIIDKSRAFDTYFSIVLISLVDEAVCSLPSELNKKITDAKLFLQKKSKRNTPSLDIKNEGIISTKKLDKLFPSKNKEVKFYKSAKEAKKSLTKYKENTQDTEKETPKCMIVLDPNHYLSNEKYDIFGAEKNSKVKYQLQYVIASQKKEMKVEFSFYMNTHFANTPSKPAWTYLCQKTSEITSVSLPPKTFLCEYLQRKNLDPTVQIYKRLR